MLIFEKNGEGYFDFDFNALVELTSEYFAKVISECLESMHIKAIELDEGAKFITVFVIDSGLIFYFSFNKENGKVIVSHMPLHAAEWASKKMGELYK